MNQNNGKLLYLNYFLLIFLMVSCTAPMHIQPQTYAVEKERAMNKSVDTIWQSAVEWFATHNMPIKNLDKSSGLISTEYSLSLANARQYMNCGAGESNFSGKVELENPTVNFNILIKKMNENSSKVSVNAFFGCTVNHYRYENLLSTNYVLVSSTKTNCASRGLLEKEILDYLSSN